MLSDIAVVGGRFACDSQKSGTQGQIAIVGQALRLP